MLFYGKHNRFTDFLACFFVSLLALRFAFSSFFFDSDVHKVVRSHRKSYRGRGYSSHATRFSIDADGLEWMDDEVHSALCKANQDKECKMSHEAAVSVCRSAGEGWRLPFLEELKAASHPCLKASCKVCGGCTNPSGMNKPCYWSDGPSGRCGVYWTLSISDDDLKARALSQQDGKVMTPPAASLLRFRCVRDRVTTSPSQAEKDKEDELRSSRGTYSVVHEAGMTTVMQMASS
eukprot:TRINITY_DN1591_c3_g1_i1.p1 TRINITY_DN1591_c3_g1~~TRINITY_DN1591_c3_g1_i1.p1  ORF type:complete len:234 (-),score=28.36 TRINITY_DN1591_c3_g1_i1:51-752(-)